MTTMQIPNKDNFDVVELSDKVVNSLPKDEKSEVVELREEVVYMKNNTDAWVEDEVTELEKIIETMPDREPKDDNNITMKEHLSNSRERLNNNPDTAIGERIAERNDRAYTIIKREVDE